MNKDEALKMTIGVLENYEYEKTHEVIEPCKEALEQPALVCEGCGSTMTDSELATKRETNKQLISCCPDRNMVKQPAQEPVGYIDKEQLNRWEKLRGTPYESPERAYIGFSKIPYKDNLTDCSLAVYTHPAPSWQGLSDDEIDKIDTWGDLMSPQDMIDFARAIESELRRKNNGY